MSPTKKLILSIGGAILGHVVLLGAVAGLLVLSLLAGPPELNAALISEAAPKEITISFSDLVEKMEITPPPEAEKKEPEPEEPKTASTPKPDEPKPEPEDSPDTRGFVRTFADQETEDAPKNASAESDRNTIGASTSAPDPNDVDALKNMPNQDGKDLPFVMLRDRKFIDGEFLDKESGGANTVSMLGNPAQPTKPNQQQQQEPSPDPFKESKQAQANPADQPAKKRFEETDPDSPPETEMPDNAGPKREGEPVPNSEIEEQPEIAADDAMKSPAELAENPQEAPENANPDRPNEADRIPTNPGEEPAQPDAREFLQTPRMAEAEKSFLIPLTAGAPIIVDEPADQDQTAVAQRREKNIGPAAELETPQPFSSSKPAPESAPLPPPSTTEKSEQQQQAAMTQPIQATPINQTSIPQPTVLDSQPINPTAVQNDTASFLAEMSKTKVSGTLSNVKKSASFDAEKTPLGQYKSAVSKSISRTWHRYRLDNMDAVSWGMMNIKFSVDRNGNVKNLKVVKNKANSMMAEFTLKAILDADLPKMPDSIADLLGPRGLQMDYDIFVH